MSKCKFTKELERLRKSSSDSIDHVDDFDDFKVYMHVVRNVENDLKSILKKVNDTGEKTLVLLCGSAGDGKSHMLSYLRNADEEHLIDNYIIHNDATESKEPSKSAIDTLNELLDGFKDINISMPGENVILAINLGVLSNFIEEHGEDYTLLKRYVEKNGILSTQLDGNQYEDISHFQHVSFSDYHMFSLEENGVNPDYILQLMKKIFEQNEDNIFFQTYKTGCSECSLAVYCPVKANYEYMMNQKCRNYVANAMVRAIIVNKIILTTREILNYFYDILVPQQFNKTKLERLAVDVSKYLKEYLNEITPTLMFECCNLTVLMNYIRNFDPLQARTEESDEFAIQYHVATNISNDVLSIIENTPYGTFLTDKDKLYKISNDKTLKLQLFNTLIRIHAMTASQNEDDIYHGYLKDLYYYNAGKRNKLSGIYSMVQKSVLQWCGKESDDCVCLEEHYDGYTLYENIEFAPYLANVSEDEHINSLQRFLPVIIVQFKGINNPITLNIDFTLYSLMYRLERGYIQTANDRNNHADFISFISQILKTGSSNRKLFILDENKTRATIEETEFGYKFRVVK